MKSIIAHYVTCDFKGLSIGSLKQHKENKHLGIRYACNDCSYQASDKSSLSRHERIIHNGETNNIKCNLCPFKTSYRNHFNYHMDKNHINPKPTACEKCDRTFSHVNGEKQER